MDLHDAPCTNPPLPASGPRERALESGAAALGDAELLAVVLGTGLAGRPASLVAAGLLDRFSGLDGLIRHGPAAIAEHPGIGLVKALRISAALELGRRAAHRAARPRQKICTSIAVAEYMQAMLGPLAHEEMWILALDGKNCLRSAKKIGQGGLHACTVTPRDVLRTALGEAASTMVLVHNHPDGDPAPSPSDTSMTRIIADLGRLLGVPLVDHVIVTPDGRHSSLLDLGVIDPV